jgi:hypothetical protein
MLLAPIAALVALANPSGSAAGTDEPRAAGDQPVTPIVAPREPALPAVPEPQPPAPAEPDVYLAASEHSGLAAIVRYERLDVSYDGFVMSANNVGSLAAGYLRF